MRFASLLRDHLGVASRTASSPTHRGVTACLDSILATISLAFADPLAPLPCSQIIYDGRAKTDVGHNSRDCAKRRTEHGIVL